MQGLNLKRDLITLLILALVALGCGLLMNRFREHPLPLIYQTKAERLEASVNRIRGDQQSDDPSNAPNTESPLPANLALEEFAKIVETKQALILDARPALFYRIGHVPGALSLPRENFDHGYAALKGKLESNHAQPIVIYCSDPSCEDSKLVRDSLKKLGYTNLSLFEPGWSAWSEAGKPKEIAP